MKITDLRVKTIYAIGQATRNRFDPGVLLSVEPWALQLERGRDRDIYGPDSAGKGWGTTGSGRYATVRGLLVITCNPDPAVVDDLTALAEPAMAHLVELGSAPTLPASHRLRLVRPQEVIRPWGEQLIREEEERVAYAELRQRTDARQLLSERARRHIAETVGGRAVVPAFSPHQRAMNIDWCDLESLCRAYAAGITEEPVASRPAAPEGDS